MEICNHQRGFALEVINYMLQIIIRNIKDAIEKKYFIISNYTDNGFHSGILLSSKFCKEIR